MATLIPANDTPRYIAPANGRSFTLRELQTIVGGYIQMLVTPWTLVDLFPGTRRQRHWSTGILVVAAERDGAMLVMFLNEDGKRLQLPVNRFATTMMRAILQPDDFIVGDVIVCTLVEAGEDDSASSCE